MVLNDRLGKKVRVKCNEDDTICDLKKLVAAQTGTRADKIRIQTTSTKTTSLSRITRFTMAWASSSTTTKVKFPVFVSSTSSKTKKRCAVLSSCFFCLITMTIYQNWDT